ncbi:MAG: VWA domain-containing protein [Acidobacteriota bacterium]|nr:VWA domain-containing protein [Acidobacteriota bacterium]
MSTLPHFAHPWWLLALLMVPVLVWHRHRHQSQGALPYSRLPGPARGAWRIHTPFYLRLLAFALLVTALARPQIGFAWEESLTEGIDIEIVLDISGSMGAEDFQPRNRLAVAKEVVKDFVRQRPADRLGLVVFSGSALTRSPLTSDRSMLEFLIDSVQLNTLPDGTAIGVALASAAARLQNSEAESRVMILVTDGVNNSGAIDPLSATAICKGLGIRVYTIGVGTRGRVPVPLIQIDPRTGRRRVTRQMMEVEVDEELLRKIAERTSGQYFEATNPESLRRVFDEIDQMEKTPLEIKRYVRYEEAFGPLAAGGLALVLVPLLAALLGQTVEP